MATNAPSGGLSIPATHVSHFPQTGSWNMIDLAKTPITATVGVLSRYCAGRVNPYTAVVGQALCANFQLTQKGRNNVEEALLSLNAVGSLGDALYFGLGVQDLVRSLATTEEGAVCLALFAALADCYSEDVAVEVILELARATKKVEGQYMPSSLEWKALLRACSGTLSTTSFSVRAETFMSLCPKQERLGGFNRLEAVPTTGRRCSSPKSIAEALIGLSTISRKKLHAMTVVGQADVGWLAAVAEWLLDLRISVTDSSGKSLYENSRGDDAQLLVVFGPANATSDGALQCLGNTYILEDATELIQAESNSPAAGIVSGRLTWKTALSSAYLSEFRKLKSLPSIFSEVIGSAARIFRAIAEADKRIPLKYRSSCRSYCTQAYGKGFVQNVSTWFPELRELQTNAEKAARSKFEEAKRAYESCVGVLRTNCGCKVCRGPGNGFDIVADKDHSDEMTDDGEHESDTASSESNSDADWDPDVYCLVVLAETILCLSRTLANMVVAEDLSPTRAGFDLAYERQLTLRRSAHLAKKAILEMGPIVFCLDFDEHFSWTIDEDAAEERLYTALQLFAGRKVSRGAWGLSAHCANGICAFLDILRDVSVDAEVAGRIQVLPGHIELEKKSYTSLQDQTPKGGNDDLVLPLKAAHASEDLYEKPKLRVKEGPNHLQCLMEFKGSNTQNSPILIGPAKLASILSTRRGLVPCPQKDKPCIQVPGLEVTVQERYQSMVAPGKTLHFYRLDSDESAMLALVAIVACLAQLSENFSIYLVSHLCYQCCVRAALAVDRPERDNFCFIHSPLLGLPSTYSGKSKEVTLKGDRLLGPP
jgi:hypothetical protein